MWDTDALYGPGSEIVDRDGDHWVKEMEGWQTNGGDRRSLEEIEREFGPVSQVRYVPASVFLPNPTPGSDWEAAAATRYEEAKAVLVRKHKDYGPDNIARAPGGALNGIRVRVHDKLSRINHLIDTGAEPENESLRDSFLDLVNYGIIGLMVLDEVWESKDSP
jgi:hypothetical protein